jgi:23S rRNA pseudouridine1911/1915/1917 synthase
VIVLAQDRDWLWLCKPAMVPVFPPHERPAGDCVLARLLAGVPGQAEPEDGPWPEGFAGGILHRLDTATSGLLVVAKSLPALALGRERFGSRQLRKRYRFLSAGDVAWDEHTVSHALAHDPRRAARMVWQRGSRSPHRGRWYEAETSFLRRGRHGTWTVWSAEMSTGVTHQIRVHAASAGIAIVGDRLYGGPEDPRGGGRFYLHHEGIGGWPGSPTVEPEDWP